MKSLLLTNEFPPHVYGGAGVHVEYLTRELSKLIETEVRCFGDQDSKDEHTSVKGHDLQNFVSDACPKNLQGLMKTLGQCLSFNMDPIDADVVHCHTWYSHFGGILAKILYGKPLFVTVHSLEPLRPWKREQLGGGYDMSSWVEKTAMEMADCVIAVSEETAEDVRGLFDVKEENLKVVYNGIDTDQYSKTSDKQTLLDYGVDPDQPVVLFVGRITRQKGIIHLVNAIKHMDPGFQVVLCAGAPDTPEIADEMHDAVNEVQKERDGVIWIDDMITKEGAIELYSHAEVFCCPSIYEPFGIINLEAMSCETAVVASAVGGIKEVVVPEETGLLIPVEQLHEAPYEPVNPEQFSKDLAAGVNRLMADEDLRNTMASNGRKRAQDKFSWTAIAEQIVDLYKEYSK
ncbi:MAG: glycogen synthase [Lentisphaeraceae bacterium]|nr:glycogen synthase [Lentisphaeraceae bacterium]